MKNVFGLNILLLAMFSQLSFADGTANPSNNIIELKSGSEAVIEANTKTTVKCVGSSKSIISKGCICRRSPDNSRVIDLLLVTVNEVGEVNNQLITSSEASLALSVKDREAALMQLETVCLANAKNSPVCN